MDNNTILSTIITSSTVETLVAQAVAAALPVPPVVAIPEAVLEILGGLMAPRRRRPRGWSRRLDNRAGNAFARRALRVDALLQGHTLETESRPVARVQDIILALDVVQRAYEASEVEEERVELLGLEDDLQKELEAVTSDGFSRHFAGRLGRELGSLEFGDLEGARLDLEASIAASLDACNDEADEEAVDASQGVWDPDSAFASDGGSFAGTEWDGTYQASLEAQDAGIVQIAPLSGPDAEAEVAKKIADLFDATSEVETWEVLKLARCERPADVAGLLARMGFEASSEDLVALRTAIFGGRVSFAPDWEARTFWQSRQEAYSSLIEELIASCRSPQSLVSIQGRLRFAMVVSKARSQGKTTTPQGQPLPRGLEGLGLPFESAARLSNQAAFKAAWLVAPDANWLERQAKLTYKVGDVAAKAEAEAYATKLEAFLQGKVAKGLRLYAIGVYPERPSSTPEDADILDGHNARQGSFLATEAPCEPEAEERLSQLSIRELLEEPLKGSWVEEQPWGCFRLSPSVLVGNRSDEVAEMVGHRAQEEVAPGVVKTLWAPKPWEVSAEEAPALEGWDSLHALARHVTRSLL